MAPPKKKTVKKRVAKKKAVKRKVAPKKKVTTKKKVAPKKKVTKRKVTPKKNQPKTFRQFKKRRLGRPSPYRKEFGHMAKVACQLGATDEDLAALFQVTKRTIHAWKRAHPDDFLHPLKIGKAEADERVMKSLFGRACGYSHVDTKFASFEGVITDMEEYTKHYPPDTTACIFWLKNRDPENWKDKQEGSGSATEDIAEALLKLTQVLPT